MISWVRGTNRICQTLCLHNPTSSLPEESHSICCTNASWCQVYILCMLILFSTVWPEINHPQPKSFLCFYSNKQEEEVNFRPRWQSEDLQTQAKRRFLKHRAEHATTRRRFNGILTFVRGDGDVRDEGVQLVGGVFVFIAFPGQTHTHAVRHVPAKTWDSALNTRDDRKRGAVWPNAQSKVNVINFSKQSQ